MDFFKGKKAVIATKHHKEKVISPILKNNLGLDSFLADKLDTNKFGTFTRTKKRIRTQLQTAISKAKAAIKLTGAEIAIASEGSFSDSSGSLFLQRNLELVLLYCPSKNLIVTGVHSAFSPQLRGEFASSVTEALDIVSDFNFPNFGIVLRSNPNSFKILTEEITSINELKTYLEQYFSKKRNKQIFIETDMRAHRNPARMQNIEAATNDLLQKLLTNCPKCSLPGFGTTNYQGGLPCQICHTPTSLKMYHIKSCSACQHTQTELINPDQKADPTYCKFCNP